MDGEGRLWVGSGHDNTVFHVFDHSGEYLHDRLGQNSMNSALGEMMVYE